MHGKIAFKHDAASAGIDESSASSEIGGASQWGEVETDEIGNVRLGCCQLRVSGCKAESENVYVLSAVNLVMKNYETTNLQAS